MHDGDLHCHTNAIDGADTLEAMARAALDRSLASLRKLLKRD